jgi:hypothetical protein
MSLHVQLSSEACSNLERQKKISTILSFSLSLLFISFTCFILAYFLIPSLSDPVPPGDPYPWPVVITEPPIEKPVFPTVFERNPSPPSNVKSPVISADTLSTVAVPTPDLDVSTPSLDFGEDDDFGTDIGIGNESGADFINLPPGIRKRCSNADRIERLKEMGGTKECDDAVIKALDWLQTNQSANGSWTGGNKPAAMTGLALLAYLGHCETPISQKYGETVVRAITYLVDLGLKNDGKLSENPNSKHWPYDHAIATYALAEAAMFCKQMNYDIPHLAELTQQAGQFIIDNQHTRSGGWDYNYDRAGNRGGDLSIAAWHIQALKACDHTGLAFKGLKKSLRDGARYVAGLSNDRGGFGYTGSNSHNSEYDTLTGAGVLCLQIAGMENTKEARSGIQYIRKNSKFEYDTQFADLYGHYYEAQAMMNRGGKDWDWYNNMFREQLLKSQLTNGSWPAPGGKSGGKIRAVAPQYTSNEVYRVCLNTLMLEVYYRFLPGTGKL